METLHHSECNFIFLPVLIGLFLNNWLDCPILSSDLLYYVVLQIKDQLGLNWSDQLIIKDKVHTSETVLSWTPMRSEKHNKVRHWAFYV
jgi:hypothetical protein